MSANDLGAAGDRPAKRSSQGSAVRRPTAWLAAVGVVVLLAAAFALSYDAFAALARQGGVNALLARYYPVVFDAMLVVAFAAIFVLRTARVYVRLLTWLSAFLILAVCAAAGAAYAAEIHIPRQPLAAAIATAPFLLLVLAFRLWLTMLRHIRRGAAARRRTEPAEYIEAEPEPARRRGTRPVSPLALPPATPSATEAGAGEAVIEPRVPSLREPVRRDPATREAERSAPPESKAREAERPVAPESGAMPPEPEPVAPEAERPVAPEPEPVAREAERPAPPEVVEAAEEPEAEDEPETAGRGPDLDVRDEQATAEEPREPTLEDLAAAVELAELGEPVASLEPDEADLDENRPPLPRRQRIRPAPELGEEDEFVADDGPQSDPVSDEAEPADDVDEFAEFEAEPDEVPPPPSGRVRSSPLPPLDWGPGLGGLTGRRRTPRPQQDESDTA